MDNTDAVVTGRERRLVATFVELADTLVEDFDVVELLYTLTERVVEMSIASEAGILLADEVGDLQFMAASDERTHLLELFQVQNQEGPCQDCFLSGRPVGAADLEDARELWPLFAPKALSVGFRSVQAVPLRLRGDILGALNLFRNEPGGIGDADQLVVQAMGDIATIGLLQQREAQRAATVTNQLQHALHSRISIEQAKGVISEQIGSSIEDSFALLRSHSRRHNHKLSDLARAVVEREIDADGLSG
ncbi:GAF and ANTAR domain-containing protein [Nitriliruptor alkaliphilus]|uniref:GAF and ANTAR domain-containing protein n=1 Tax=Nitriliruptor alkaliphilus TaxID=427918 RepID=UPI000697A00B|nr:GAF and ANTAR domain-containing protein [Nitriliruptor alkaliphilus]